METYASPELIRDILNAIFNNPIRQDAIDPNLGNIIKGIRIPKFSQIEIGKIHFRMRNGDLVSSVIIDYNFDFAYDISLLEKIILFECNDNINNFDFLSTIVMYSYIAWEIKFEQTDTMPNVTILLDSLLKVRKSKNSNIIAKIIFQVFSTFLLKDKNLSIYSLMPQFLEFSQYYRSQTLFISIIRHLSKYPNDPQFQQFLNDFTSILDAHESFFSEDSLFQIVQYLLNLFAQMDHSSLRFLRKATKSLSERISRLLIPMFPISILYKLKKFKPINIAPSKEEHEIFPYTGTTKCELDFSDVLTLPNGFDPSFSIQFPPIIEISSFFRETQDNNHDLSKENVEDNENKNGEFIENNLLKSLSLVAKCVRNENIAFLVECYFDIITKNSNDPHIYNLILSLLYICSKIPRIFLPTDKAQCFFHPLIFNVNDTLFNYLFYADNTNNNKIENSSLFKSDFNIEQYYNHLLDLSDDQKYQITIFSTLRSLSLDYILSDDGFAIDTIFQSSFMGSPLFVSELFSRLANVSSLLAMKTSTNLKLIKTISSLTLFYQYLEMTIKDEMKLEMIRLARVCIFSTIAHMFTDSKTLHRFYDNQLFMNSFSVFLFEDAIRPFVVSTLTTYISNVDLSLNYDLTLMFNHILNNINLHLPGRRQIVLLKDIIGSLVEGLAYHQKGIENFTETCKILCQSIASLSTDELSKNVYELGITLLALMSPYFEMTSLEIEALITGLISFNDQDFIKSLYQKFLSLLAGQSAPPNSPNFIIKQQHVLKLLIQTYSHIDDLDKVITFVNDLCKFSPKNLSVCSKSDLDIVLLKILENEKKNEEWSKQLVQKFLDFYSLISLKNSTTQSVLRYISLLSPITENTLSSYHVQFIDNLNSLISSSSDEPSSTFPLNGKKTNKEPFQFLKKLEDGFAITFWIYIEQNISDYRPKICTLYFSEYLRFGIFLSNGAIFLFQDEDDTEITAMLCESMQEQKWHFITILFQFTEHRTFIHYTVDCSYRGITTIPPLVNEINQDDNNFHIKIGGSFRNSKIQHVSLPSKLGALSLFYPQKLDEFIQIYELGLRNINYNPISSPPFYFKINYSDYDDKTTFGFTDVLINQCGISCILPLFLQTDMIMSNNSYTLPLEMIIILLTNILTYSINAQQSFYQSKGFSIIAELLTERWAKYFSFKNYQQLFGLLLVIQFEPLQQQLFDEVMTNFTFLMHLDSILHLRILKHWWQSLFPSFKLIAFNFSSFEDLVAVLRLFYWYQPVEIMKIKYYSIRPKDLNIEKCRKYILGILYDYSAESFDLDMFDCVVSHCISCTELKQVEELIQFLIRIFNDLPKSITFNVETTNFINFIHYYLKYPCEELRILVLNLLIIAHKQSLISNDYFHLQLDIIALIIPNDIISPSLLSFLISELLVEPLLLNLCCYLTAYIFDVDSTKIILSNKSTRETLRKSNSRLWAIGPLCLGIYILPEMIDSILYEAKERISDLILQYDLFLPYSEFFENKLVEFIKTHRYDISEPLEACQRLIGFTKNKTSLFTNSSFHVFETKFTENHNVIKEENDFSPRKLISRLFMNDLNKPTLEFQLKFENNEWLHVELAKIFLKKLEEQFNQNYLAFDLMLCSFLQTTDFDVFEHLCSIYLNDRDLSSCESILPLLEYHTKVNGKRHFLRNQFFSNPFPLEKNYYSFLSQISPKYYHEKLHKLFVDFTNYQKILQENVKNAHKADISDSIEIATKQMTQFIDRQDFQNELNLTSWRLLWSALSIERAPWFITSLNSSNPQKYELQRESSANFGLAPVKMVKKVFQAPPNTNAYSNIIVNRGVILESQCKVISIEFSHDAQFYLFKDFIRIRVHNKRTFDIDVKTITHIFLRKNNGCHLFTNTGYTFHIEFPESYFLNQLLPILSTSVLKGSFVQTIKSNKNYFPILPYQSRWRLGKMSNYEYILMLNHCVGRSFHDSSNYPFMPYVLNDFSTTNNFRDFTKMSGDTPISKKDVFVYLRSIEPFKSIQKRNKNENNGNPNNFDSNCENGDKDDDLIYSCDDFLHYAQENKTELVPEFYSMPELFSEINFALPMWSNTPMEFVYLHRKALESDLVSQNLHIWITKHFGDKSSFNLFSGSHPHRNVKNSNEKMPKIQRFVEIPSQLKEKVLSVIITEEKSLCFKFILLLESGTIQEVVANLSITSSSATMPLSMHQSSILPKKTSYNSLLYQNKIKSNTELDKLTSNDTSINHDIINNHMNKSINKNLNKNWNSTLNNGGVGNGKNKSVSGLSNNSESKFFISNDSKIVVLNHKFIVANRSIVVYDTINNKHNEIEIDSQKITCLACDNPFIVSTGENSMISVILDNKIIQSIRLFRDMITCISVSQVFNIVACGTTDGSLVICSASNGNLIRVIQLSKNNELTPQKVLITSSWGFIVAYCTEIVSGVLKHLILVFSVNGTFVQKCELTTGSKIDYWRSWTAPSNGFDYLIYSNEAGHLFFVETFKVCQTHAIYSCRSRIVGAHFSNDESILAVSTSDGKLAFIPIVVN
ncbi:hypothetical protein TRFO_25702 [Tritrichomonas foetus]|uniref:BEACH domain-containing protein n=1 Tax=Tritrichomonas foetus TaxID=1144522 RepID=A0A1J4K5Y5_9EUKA|nr:hypothetical protein TRFO_25702 [Tritrichomonas foetus]|eukprot:OHT06288.1 hypothetical protein TRFO_25702 [Tritrichomonas foetus]